MIPKNVYPSGLRFPISPTYLLLFLLYKLKKNRLVKRVFIALGFFLTASPYLRAQNGYSNLEFVENKGQWEKQVILKGELTNGSIFLQKKRLHGFVA